MKDKASPKHVIVIGAGFSGLAAACHLAKAGCQVTVLEKHEQPGGRARLWEQDGFRFDMGPSWYWMPDVFERFFAQFDHDVSDFYELKRLDPSYRVVFDGGDVVDVPASMSELSTLFERYEPGAAASLEKFLDKAAYIYDAAMKDYLFRPSLSVTEFFDVRLAAEMFRLKMLESMHKFAKRYFRHPHLVRLVEWPVIFLGASAQKTSAMYSLMTYADMALGTWYPKGGMHRIIEGMVSLATSLGVQFRYNHEVSAILTHRKAVTGVRCDQPGGFKTEAPPLVLDADAIVAAADYHHVEQHLLPSEERQYSPRYWDKRVMSPSSLLFYLGVKGKIPALEHHTLFFDRDMDRHMDEVYKTPQWPTEPLFYACMPSKTDAGSAPKGHENLFILVPLAAGLEDSEAEREACYDKVMARLEEHTGRDDLRDAVVLKRSYAMNDFVTDYHAFKGNAYGMANTLKQTGPLKPKLRSEKVSGLYYAGQLTVPGPGMPPSLISGELASHVLLQDHR